MTEPLPRPPRPPGPHDWHAPVPRTATGPVASAPPVLDVTTGEVVLLDVDVALPGDLPLVLRRSHRASWTHGRWFGSTWSSTLDERLSVRGEDVTWLRDDARAVRLPLPDVGRAAARERAPLVLLRRSAGAMVLLDPASAVERHFWGEGTELLLAAVVDRRGHRVSVVRDARGVPLEVRHSGGYRVLVESDGHRVTALRVAPPQGASPEERWGGVAVPTSPGEEARRFGYDVAGHLASVTVPGGDVDLRADLVHDAHGRLLGLGGDTEPVTIRRGDDGGIVALAASDGSWHEEVTHAPGRTRVGATTWSLDGSGRVVDVAGPAPQQLTWDDRDLLVRRTDGQGRTTAWQHDDSGRVVLERRPDGGETRWGYGDRFGPEPVEVVLADGRRWTQELDPVGSPALVTDPTGVVTRRRTSADGRRVLVIDALGATTRLERDGAGLLVREELPDGAVRRWERDPRGRVVTEVDPDGERTVTTWGPYGRTSLTLPDRGTTTWSWERGDDGALRVISTDADGVTGHVADEEPDPPVRAPADDADATSTWDAAGRRTTRAWGWGLVERWSYDAVGRPTGLLLTAPGIERRMSLEHDRCGRLRRVALDGGCAVEQLWDAAGALVAQVVHRPDEAAPTPSPGLSRLEQRLGGLDPVASTHDAPAPVLERRWTWSPAGRLLDVTHGGARVDGVASPGDGTWVVADGTPLVHVERGDEPRVRLVLGDPDGVPWALLAESGEPVSRDGDAPRA